MYSISPEPSGDAQTDELFSYVWLTNNPIRSLINTATAGVALLQAIRNESGQIIDFQYQLVNPMQQALTNHTQHDLLNHSLTALSPYVIESGMLDRLVQVVTTSHPIMHVEQYQLDGSIGFYNQLYMKSGDGVLMIVHDVTYTPLSTREQQQQHAFLDAIKKKDAIYDIRTRLLALMSGQI